MDISLVFVLLFLLSVVFLALLIGVTVVTLWYKREEEKDLDDPYNYR